MAKRKCAKCGFTSQEDTTVTFHRFPLPSVHGSLKAKVWAKWAFPNEDWNEDESLVKLFKSHKMICSNHFDDSSFSSSERQRLNKFAIPTEARGILIELRDQQHHKPEVIPSVPSTSTPSASMLQCSTSQPNELCPLSTQVKCHKKQLPQQTLTNINTNIDKLFDCMNGDSLSRKRGKLHLTDMNSTSPHLTFFKKIKIFFNDIKFLETRWLVEDIKCLGKNFRKSKNVQFKIFVAEEA